MSGALAFAFESVVALLLAASIYTMIRTEKRLRAFRLNEADMRATIATLVGATERAERAVECLRAAVETCDLALEQRLRAAEKQAQDLSRQVRAGQDVVSRIGRIVAAGRQERAG